AVTHTFLVRMLDRTADGEEQRQPLLSGHPPAIAILSYWRAFDVLHHEVRTPLGRCTRVEDPRDVRVVHHGECLALVAKAGEHLAGVHTELHNFESHTPANGFKLLGEINGAHTALAQRLDDPVAAEVLIPCRGCSRTDGAELVRAGGTRERALDQTHRAKPGGIARIQFRSALWADWHLAQIRTQFAQNRDVILLLQLNRL